MAEEKEKDNPETEEKVALETEDEAINALNVLLWKCKECEAFAPATLVDYMVLLRHQKGHHIHLVDTNTGEIVATSPKEARSRGIELPKESQVDETTAEKPESKFTVPQGMDLSEEGITQAITLPPVVFTLFDAAKAAKLVDDGRDFDSWLFECVMKRFELDYCLQLMLVPIKEAS